MRILAIALSMVPGHATSSSLSSMSLTLENRNIRGQQDLLLVACPDKYGNDNHSIRSWKDGKKKFTTCRKFALQ